MTGSTRGRMPPIHQKDVDKTRGRGRSELGLEERSRLLLVQKTLTGGQRQGWGGPGPQRERMEQLRRERLEMTISLPVNLQRPKRSTAGAASFPLPLFRLTEGGTRPPEGLSSSLSASSATVSEPADFGTAMAVLNPPLPVADAGNALLGGGSMPRRADLLLLALAVTADSNLRSLAFGLEFGFL